MSDMVVGNLTSLPLSQFWSNCPATGSVKDARRCCGFHDDFELFPLIGTQTTQIGHGRYKVFNTGAGTVVPVSAVNSVETAGGILSIALDTDNDSGAIAQAYPCFLLPGTSDGKRLWAEARIARSTIAVSTLGFMFGLAETEQWTLATGVPFNGGDAITNAASFVGFRAEEDGLGVVDTVFSDRATSFTNIGDTEGGTMAANTFVNLGIYYDPTQEDKAIRFYVNGVQTTTPMTLAQLLAKTNLDANALGLIFACVADSGLGTGYMDWWACYQER